jgi:hypothetical protein
MKHALMGGSLIQSTFAGGNFEAVVFLEHSRELMHYWRETSRPDRGWQRGQPVSRQATGAGCILQGSFGSPGNFEVAVLEADWVAH